MITDYGLWITDLHLLSLHSVYRIYMRYIIIILLCCICVQSMYSQLNYKHPIRITSPKGTNSTNNLLLPYLFSTGLDCNFNADDIMLGCSAGIMERNFRTGLFLGFDTRPVAKDVLYDDPISAYTYLYREQRSIVYASLEKRFAIGVNLALIGIFVGVKELYTFGGYKKTDIKVPDVFIFTPQAGLFWMNLDVAFRINYEYLDFYTPGVPEHRLNFSFLYFIPFKEVPLF